MEEIEREGRWEGKGKSKEAQRTNDLVEDLWKGEEWGTVIY